MSRADIAAAHGYALVGMVRELDPLIVDAYLDTVDPSLSRPARDLIVALAAMVDPWAEDPLAWTLQFVGAEPIGTTEYEAPPATEKERTRIAIANATKAGRSAQEIGVVLGISARTVQRIRGELGLADPQIQAA